MSAKHKAIDRRGLLAGITTAGVSSLVSTATYGSPPSLPAGCSARSRSFPPPSTISKPAQDYLRKGALQPVPAAVPTPQDVAGWHAYVAAGNAPLPVDLILKIPGVDVEERQMGGATVHVAKPRNLSEADKGKVHLSIHGGGWVLFGGRHSMALAKITAMQYGCVTVAVDYRMPPEHPFPAGLDDCFVVYGALLKEYGAKNILVSGGSAGGNLAAALMLKIKDAGLEKPSALVLQTPVTDLTNAGDSWKVLYGLDPVLRDPDGVRSTQLYLNGNDPRHPYLSPLFGDLALAFPPTHLVTGTRDRLLSDTVRMHAALRAAGIEADLFVSEAMPHAGFGQQTPEDQAALKDTRKWLEGRWPKA